MAEYYGIDVSRHNGSIDWDAVKRSGKVDFCIIRAGYGKHISQKDNMFERNYAGCKRVGIPVGAYWYSYAVTPAEAMAEAMTCLEAIKRKTFEYPIWFDIEERAALSTGKNNCTAMCKAFCDVLEKHGYWVGIYASRSAIEAYISAEAQKRYAIWAAEWGNRLNYSGAGIWQRSEKGSIPGVGGFVDLDVSYVDYPSAIKKARKNGYINLDTQAPKKPIYIPKITAADISVYMSWCTALGVGAYPDTQEGFDAFLESKNK